MAVLVPVAVLLVVQPWIVHRPDWFLPLLPHGWNRYSLASLALLATALACTVLWPVRDSGTGVTTTPPRSAKVAVGLVLIAGLGAVVAAARQWTLAIFAIPIDGTFADMLVVMGRALTHLSDGGNPYRLYEVPWVMPFPYGPWLWVWYLIPFSLGADLRLVTMAGQLVGPLVLALAAGLESRAGRWPRGLVLAMVAVMFASSPLLTRFVVIGHTPAFWILFVPFAMLMSAGRYRAAAVLLGALVVGRPLNVSLVPVLLIATWHRDRSGVLPVALLCGSVITLSYLPFGIWEWNWSLLWYCVIGSYPEVVARDVWTRPEWIGQTLGLTRWLVSTNQTQWVYAASGACLLAVYVAAWWDLRRGRPVAPWLCMALLAMCMTTVWPVWYVFLDVFVLAACLFAADAAPALRRSPGRTTLVVASLSLLIPVATLAAHSDRFVDIDAGAGGRRYLAGGFGNDEVAEGRTAVRALRPRVRLEVPRWSRAAAVVTVTAAAGAGSDSAATLSLSVNGIDSGMVGLRDGWAGYTFVVPDAAWQIGQNHLALTFGATPGLIDRIEIRPPARR